MKTQFITDEKGNKTGVILPIKEYDKMLEELEELEDLRAFDEAMARESDPVPYAKALKELKRSRKIHV